jgi:hypothetical protein
LSSGWDIASFIQQMQGLTSGAIQFHTIPTGPGVTIGGADVLQVDPRQVHDYVADLVDNTAPTTPVTAPATTTEQATGTTATQPTVRKIVPTTSAGPITAKGIRCVN